MLRVPSPIWMAPRRGIVLVLLAFTCLLAPPTLTGAAAQTLPSEFVPYWVQNHAETDLWSSPDEGAISFERARPFSYFHVLQPQRGKRLNVLNPLTMGTAWIDADAVGPSGPPPAGYGRREQSVKVLNLPGRIVGGANVRSEPAVADGNLVGRLGHNAPVSVLEEVQGADGDAWYRIAEGQFVHASLVRVPRPFPAHPGRVIEADLSEPVLVTAYEDGKPVYAALALKGTTGWGTPTGFFTIKRRVQNDTMDSRTLGIPNDAPGGYLLKNVLYTQYFTEDGASIHYNYWSSNFGYTGSHGCLGMSLEDSEFFWEWATVGTPVIIRE